VRVDCDGWLRQAARMYLTLFIILGNIPIRHHLEDGELVHTIAFDDPRSSTHFLKARSGRLYTKTFAPNTLLPRPVFDLSSPGSLGMCLYTYRVVDINGYRARVAGSAATRVTEVLRDEFGLRTFSFIAPDGYWWQLIERP
jgi:hypothetical protein